jgi:hypothetical protein
MHFTQRKLISGALLATLSGLTACGEELQVSEEGSASAATLRRNDETSARREASQKLTQALARALRDPSMRGLIRAAMAETLVKEDKVHFTSYVRGSGRALLQAMSRQSGLSVAQLDSLLTQAGSLEMYLPVQAHRAAWRGGEDLLVATALVDHETPIGFDLAGNPVLMSAGAPPATPTLALVPAEDFDAEGVPSARGLALGRGGQQLQALGDVSAAATAWTGAWVNSVSIPGSYESWLRGAPEYEMYMERTADRKMIRCAGEGSARPFSWNMDNKTYSTPFIIAWEGETPTMDGLAMSIYEDDDTACVLKLDMDYTKVTMDTLMAAYSAFQSVQERQFGKALITFSHALVGTKALVTGADEFVGVVASLNGAPIDTTERSFTLLGLNQTETGALKLQWKTEYTSF